MSQDTATAPEATPTQPVDPLSQEVKQDTYEDYWGVQETHRFYLPDNKQYFDIVPMNEGAKTRFQKLTNKGIRMNQRTQDATIDVDPADERHTLIKESVTGWHLMMKSPDGQWDEFICPGEANQRKRALEQLLEKFNPKFVQDLEFFIRTKNPWMQADMDVAEIDKEIDRLTELRKQVKDQQLGE